MIDLPPDIVKACMILGVRDQELTCENVVQIWKMQIVEVHPDKSECSETAILLNTAKDRLIDWLNERGPEREDPNQGAPLPAGPYPQSGSGEIQLLLPQGDGNDV
jgi:hypothetical protein